jgi:hypothetical protein
MPQKDEAVTKVLNSPSEWQGTQLHECIKLNSGEEAYNFRNMY